MSTQRGNLQRTRAQKYQNQTAFKNTLYDKTKKTREINSLNVLSVCDKCKGIIEWKIKYKKYKPLTVARKCNKCDQKTVKTAYHTICDPCVKTHRVCGKCGTKADAPIETPLEGMEKAKEEAAVEREVKMLPERKRRTVLRYIKKGEPIPERLKNNNDQDSDSEDLYSDFDDLNVGSESEDSSC